MVNQHYSRRGNNFDFTDSEPYDGSSLDPEIISSAATTIRRIIDAGYPGVGSIDSIHATTGRPVNYVLYDPATIEGMVAGTIIASLPTATEPYKTEEILMLITGSYMIKSLCDPDADCDKGDQE